MPGKSFVGSGRELILGETETDFHWPRFQHGGTSTSLDETITDDDDVDDGNDDVNNDDDDNKA